MKLSRLRKLILLLIALQRGGVWFARKLGVTVGDGCRIYTFNWGSEPFLVTLGDRVTVTSGVKFLTHDGATWLVRDRSDMRYQRYGAITVGSDVFIGVNSVIMPGVTIGSKVVIGAGSVVTKSIPGDSVVAGVPARIVCRFEEYCAKISETCAKESELSGENYKARVLDALRVQNERR